jgi:hypothetical protein
MGKILSLSIGALVTLIGLILFFVWWYEILFVLRAVVPLMLVFGGLIAVIAGLSELKDTLKSKK